VAKRARKSKNRLSQKTAWRNPRRFFVSSALLSASQLFSWLMLLLRIQPNSETDFSRTPKFLDYLKSSAEDICQLGFLFGHSCLSDQVRGMKASGLLDWEQ
jgi:hypothetical protein